MIEEKFYALRVKGTDWLFYEDYDIIDFDEDNTDSTLTQIAEEKEIVIHRDLIQFAYLFDSIDKDSDEIVEFLLDSGEYELIEVNLTYPESVETLKNNIRESIK